MHKMDMSQRSFILFQWLIYIQFYFSHLIFMIDKLIVYINSCQEQADLQCHGSKNVDIWRFVGMG